MVQKLWVRCMEVPATSGLKRIASGDTHRSSKSSDLNATLEKRAQFGIVRTHLQQHIRFGGILQPRLSLLWCKA